MSDMCWHLKLNMCFMLKIKDTKIGVLDDKLIDRDVEETPYENNFIINRI